MVAAWQTLALNKSALITSFLIINPPLGMTVAITYHADFLRVLRWRYRRFLGFNERVEKFEFFSVFKLGLSYKSKLKSAIWLGAYFLVKHGKIHDLSRLESVHGWLHWITLFGSIL